jgi:uncharacterized membrane protein SpoIIM required for sporulation
VTGRPGDSLQDWVRTRRDAWSRIAAENARKGRSLDLDTAERRVRDYRQTARDVARARRDLPGSGITAGLETMFRVQHAQLHRDFNPWNERLRRLYGRDVPAAMQQLRGTLLLTIALFVVAIAATALLVRTFPELISLFASDSMIDTVEKGRLWTEPVFAVLPPSASSAGIITNNIVVSLLAFALGTLYGVGTIYVVLLNGAILGALFVFTAQHGVALNLLRFVVPHGGLELSVILLSAAAGLRVGEAVVRPGAGGRGESLREAVAQAAVLLAVVVPALVIAGSIEGFISPDPDIGWAVRIAVSLTSTGVLWAFLLRRAKGTAPIAATRGSDPALRTQ